MLVDGGLYSKIGLLINAIEGQRKNQKCQNAGAAKQSRDHKTQRFCTFFHEIFLADDSDKNSIFLSDVVKVEVFF